jgi:hypothetical protein
MVLRAHVDNSRSFPVIPVAAERGRDGRVQELIGSALRHRDRRAVAAGPAMGGE